VVVSDTHQTILDAQATISAFERRYPLATIVDDVTKYQTALLEFMSGSNIISADEIVAMQALNPFYVPMDIQTYDDFGQKFDDGIQMSVTLDTRKPLKHIRTLDINNISHVTPPLDAMLANTHKAFSAVAQNQVSWGAVHALHIFQQSFQADGNSIIQRIPSTQDLVLDDEGNPVKDRDGHFMLKTPKDKGMIVIGVRHEHAYDSSGQLVKGGGSKTTVFEPGEEPAYNDDLPMPGFFTKPVVQYYQVPLEAYEVMRPYVGAGLFEGRFGDIAVVAANVLRYTAVTSSAPFYFRNIHRDFSTATFVARHGMDAGIWAKELLKNTADAMNILQKEDLLAVSGIRNADEWLMMAAGAGLSSSILMGDNYALGVGDTARQQRKKSAAVIRRFKAGSRSRLRQIGSRFSPYSISRRDINPDFVLARFTAASEKTTRTAAFLTALSRTNSLREAAHASRNASGDWATGGRYTTALARFLPFIKAEFIAMKSLALSMREFADNETPLRREHLARAFGRAVLIVATRTLLLAMGYPGEDEETRMRRKIRYLQGQGWLRYGFVQYPLPGGGFINFPASQLEMSINVAVDAMVRQAIYASGDDLEKFYTPGSGDAAYKNFFNYSTGRVSPVGFNEKGNLQLELYDYMPQVVSPLIQLTANYDAFRRRAIEPDWMKSKLIYDRYWPSTPIALRELSRWANDNDIPLLNSLSPIQMDFLVNGYTATFGGQMIDVASLVMTGEVDDYNGAEGLNPLRRLTIPYETLGARGTASKRVNEILNDYENWKRKLGDAEDAIDAAELEHGGDSKEMAKALADLDKLEDTVFYRYLSKSARKADGTINKSYTGGVKKQKYFSDVEEKTRKFSDYLEKRRAENPEVEDVEIMLEVTEILVDFLNAYDEAELESINEKYK